ncbi:hypothetical protein CC78DRAFT_547130 [Lojkania enalia]|uniref:Uncharacterized protein n=1 Tax=Lojkania enalia TaxID=147567 RepID=A0A9P4K1L1_9PLEO|nr:hypothetical protein CC78DRAFT_547130 [Didymosphaeria enalia]
MRSAIVLTGLLPVVYSLAVRATPEWSPAEGTAATCTESAYGQLVWGDKSKDELVKNACNAILNVEESPCNGERKNKMICLAITPAIKGPIGYMQSACFEKDGVKRCDKLGLQLTITPPGSDSEDSTGVTQPSLMWKDCVGYFNTIFDKPNPIGCAKDDGMPHLGEVKASGGMKGSVFKASLERYPGAPEISGAENLVNTMGSIAV